MTFTKNNNTIICHYYKEHRNDIFLFVCGRIGDSCVAEDIVQTVFERLLCSTRMITEVTLPALVWHVARNLYMITGVIIGPWRSMNTDCCAPLIATAMMLTMWK